MKKSNLFLAIFKTLGLLLLFIAVGLFCDSYIFIQRDQNLQHYANIAMLREFFILWYMATNRSREIMLYALLIGIASECLFSLGFDMFEYRLKNVII